MQKSVLIHILLVSLLLLGASPPQSQLGDWPQATPAQTGLDVAAVQAHEALCKSTAADACLIVHKGQIVSEWYGPAYQAPVSAMSSTKAITSLLVGMLIDAGRIDSVDTPVHHFIPAWQQGLKQKANLRHLLTHSVGLERIHDQRSVGNIADKNPYVIGLPLDYEPGTRYAYSNEGVQLLSPILDSAAGEPIQDFARKQLFEPLGMTQTRLHLDSAGHAWTYADMETSPRDFARIGQLMLQQGQWQGQQLVSADWLRESLSPSPLNPDLGYLWWLYPELKGYAALGYLDTNLYVFPEQQLVVVRIQNRPAAGETPVYRVEALKIFRRLLKIEQAGPRELIDEMFVLNRSGQAQAALSNAQKVLALPGLNQQDRCKAEIQSAFSLIQLRQFQPAEAKLAYIDQQCGFLDQDSLGVAQMLKQGLKQLKQ